MFHTCLIILPIPTRLDTSETHWIQIQILVNKNIYKLAFNSLCVFSFLIFKTLKSILSERGKNTSFLVY